MSSTMLFKQLFDQSSCTYTYLLADTQTSHAIFIDTVYEQHERDLSLIRELELDLIACIDTHCHADHVTGSWLLKHALGSQIVASKQSGIGDLDRALVNGDKINFGSFNLEVLETPGHTNGCISLVNDNKTMVFTGDCLLIRACGRTDFQQGSAHNLYHSITEKLFSLPDNCIVYPGHDYSGRTSSTIGEEKKFNPRVGGDANETDFTGYMDNMQLPHPKKIAIALPANLKSGRPDEVPQSPDWAPVITSYSGYLEVSPQWVAAHKDEVHILDVRTEQETNEEKARISNAQMIPIDKLRDHLNEVPKDKPVLTICRSGKRSALAFEILREAGWSEVANISGGLLRWNAEGLPVD